MSDMDAKILEAIKTETDETMRDYGRELGLFGLIAESFRGTFRWTVIGVMVLQVVFIAATVYCVINLYGTDDPATKLNWLAPGLAAFIVFGLLRFWFLMELNRLSLAREIKRLELQIAALVNALRSFGGDSQAR